MHVSRFRTFDKNLRTFYCNLISMQRTTKACKAWTILFIDLKMTFPSGTLIFITKITFRISANLTLPRNKCCFLLPRQAAIFSIIISSSEFYLYVVKLKATQWRRRNCPFPINSYMLVLTFECLTSYWYFLFNRMFLRLYCFHHIVKAANWDQRFPSSDKSKPDFLLAHVTNLV